MAAHRVSDLLEHPPLALGGIQLIVTCSVFTPLAIVAVGLRLWARRITGLRLVFNDWAIVAALVFNCGQTALLIYASVTGGVGHHITELIQRWPAAVPRLSKSYVAAEPLWISTNSLIKLSILHFYIRIFPVRDFHRLCYAIMAVVVAYFISTFVRMFFLCTPFAAVWDPSLLVTVPGAFCINLRAAYIAVSVINLVLDLAIFLLPLPRLWHLQMKLQKKLALVGIFGLGFVICIITALRIYSVTILSLDDTSYTVLLDGIFSTLEPCLGIINSCIPLLRPLGSKLSSTLAWSTVNKTRSGGYRYNKENSSHHSDRRPFQTDATKPHGFIPLEEQLARDGDPALRGDASRLEARAGIQANGQHATPEDGKIVVTVDWGVRHETSGTSL